MIIVSISTGGMKSIFLRTLCYRWNTGRIEQLQRKMDGSGNIYTT